MTDLFKYILGLINDLLIKPIIRLLVRFFSKESDETHARRQHWVFASMVVWGLVGLILGLFLNNIYGDIGWELLLIPGAIYGAIYGFIFKSWPKG